MTQPMSAIRKGQPVELRTLPSVEATLRLSPPPSWWLQRISPWLDIEDAKAGDELGPHAIFGQCSGLIVANDPAVLIRVGGGPVFWDVLEHRATLDHHALLGEALHVDLLLRLDPRASGNKLAGPRGLVRVG